MIAELFVWQTLPPKPVYRHKLIEDFHSRFEFPTYLEKRTLGSFVRFNFLALVNHFIFVGSVFAIALIGSAKQLLSWVWNDYWGRFALFIYGFFIFGIMIEIICCHTIGRRLRRSAIFLSFKDFASGERVIAVSDKPF
jgi:hypothetical protein